MPVAGTAQERRLRTDQQDLEREGQHAVPRPRRSRTQPFHLYLNKKIDKPDLTGLKIRITPVYRDFFQALGANVVHDAAGRGLHGARARRGRRLRLADQRHFRPQLAGEDQVPRRPGLLQRRGVADHEPRPAWKKLTDAQRDVLQKQSIALEAQNGFWTKDNDDETKRQAAGRHPDHQVRRRDRQGLPSTRPTKWPGPALIKRAPSYGPQLQDPVLASNGPDFPASLRRGCWPAWRCWAVRVLLLR